MTELSKQALLRFLHANDIAVLATIKSGTMAHAATIYYYADNNLHLYFLTKTQTMKYCNIKENKSVALVITNKRSLQTVQVEGTAEEIRNPHELTTVVDELIKNLAKNKRTWKTIPPNQIEKGHYAFVRITPTWIRWTGFSPKENHIVKFEQYAG